MAWIESHQKLSNDPKTLAVAAAMGWTTHECIGRLHCFWWWCVDHCEDGDLRRFNDAVLGSAVALNPSEGKRFVDAMINGGDGFIDREPFFRVHNWWKFFGRFLRSKYEDHPEKWKRIKDVYESDTVTVPVPVPVFPEPNQPNLTNLTKNKRERVLPKFEKPSPADVTAYAQTLSYTLDGKRFVDHYEANGWRVGKVPMRDWRATVRNWKARDSEYPKGGRLGAVATADWQR